MRALLLFLFLASTAYADRALVVGIDRYPFLRHQANLLGAVNDANLMARRLKDMGFQVELLTDEKATLAGLRQALQRQARQLEPGERFVLYFAGHGTLADVAYLLPFDSAEGKLATDLSEHELKKLLAALPTNERTVLLDACFSESFLASRGLGLARRNRFYPKATARSVSPQGDTPALGSEQVIYFVASRQNQGAREDELGGKMHGVFTYYLADALLQPQPLLWGDLQARVSTRVAAHLGDEQHPTLTPGAAERPVFGGSAPAAEPQSANLWELYHRDRPDPARLELRMQPDRSQLKVGEKLRFTVEVGSPGYLVLLEHGVSGRIQRLYPLTGGLEAARVSPGRIEIPGPEQAFAPDRPGLERVRAFLLESPEEARALLDAYQAVDYASFARALESRQVAPGGGRWTSELNFEVRL